SIFQILKVLFYSFFYKVMVFLWTSYIYRNILGEDFFISKLKLFKEGFKIFFYIAYKFFDKVIVRNSIYGLFYIGVLVKMSQVSVHGYKVGRIIHAHLESCLSLF